MTDTPSHEPPPEQQPDIAREMSKIPYEPLLPVEKRLIVWSLVLGLSLLGLLAWLSDILFPAGGPPPG